MELDPPRGNEPTPLRASRQARPKTNLANLQTVSARKYITVRRALLTTYFPQVWRRWCMNYRVPSGHAANTTALGLLPGRSQNQLRRFLAAGLRPALCCVFPAGRSRGLRILVDGCLWNPNRLLGRLGGLCRLLDFCGALLAVV